jgi:outer membrane protein assembly factor BamB
MLHQPSTTEDSRRAVATARALGLLALASAAPLAAQDPGDWPQWGGGPERNMAARRPVDLPDEFDAGSYLGTTEQIDMATTKNVRWVAKLGSQSYGNPTVANGRVYVGTNNDTPRDERFQGDRSCVYCLDEKTGELIWQFNVPKLGTGKVSDWEYLGICSSPAIEGDRVYLVTNRCEVVCLDAKGMADGNQGVTDEGAYLAWPSETPMEVKETDADILWRFNMIDELGVFPHNITSCSVLIVGDQIWTSTSNGVDYGHVETPAPRAPSLIVVDKNTGELLGEEASGLSERIFHSNWSSPAWLRTDDASLVIFGGPDGVLYAFEPTPKVDEEGFGILQLAWQHDCNPKEYRVDEDGEPRRYATPKGPSEVLATPIVHDGLIYAVIGQDPEHGEGVGNLSCLDPEGKLVWEDRDIHRALVDDLGCRRPRVRRRLLGLRPLLRREDRREALAVRHRGAHLGLDARRRRTRLRRHRGRVLDGASRDEGRSGRRGRGDRLRPADLFVPDRRQRHALHRDAHAPVRDRSGLTERGSPSSIRRASISRRAAAAGASAIRTAAIEQREHGADR